jgi:hypothetical protein
MYYFRYASQYLRVTRLPASSRFRKWPQDGISTDDIKCFLAVPTAIGLVVQDDLQDYWSRDPVLNTPFFASVMPRDTFMNILSFFHLANNENYIPRGREGYKPLYKLGTVYQQIISNFNNVWYPGKNLSLDEGMIPFKGKSHMRVYCPDKPHKYGLKAYEVCDAANAYCCQFELYSGKAEEEPPENSKGKTYDLVMKLMRPYLHKGHQLYVDNYYSSPSLFMDLYRVGTGSTGTARNRKGMPAKIKNTVLKNKGDSVVMHNGPLMAMKLRDRKDVKILSTTHSSSVIPTGKRDRQGNMVTRTEAIHEYNKYMGAVDRSDQMVGYGSFRRRSLKWWKKVFFHVFSVALLNSWILYREWCSQNQQTASLQRVFRYFLIACMHKSFTNA